MAGSVSGIRLNVGLLEGRGLKRRTKGDSDKVDKTQRSAWPGRGGEVEVVRSG